MENGPKMPACGSVVRSRMESQRRPIWTCVTDRFLPPRQLRRVAKRRRIGEFPQNVIGDQRLPSRIVVNQCLDVLLQEVRSDCHLLFSYLNRRHSMILLAGYRLERGEVGF